ncbi:hypothetical protein U3516DRAFT_914633 [Neocallimastix sp. 'constans']|jgi:hypothetical protein
MNEYYYAIHKQKIDKPKNEVSIVESKYNFQTPVCLFVESNLEKEYNSGSDFVVTDENNVTFFEGSMKSSSSKIELFDSEGVRYIALEENTYGEGKLFNETGRKVVGTLEHKNSTVADKYNISFHNLAIGREEVLSMNCDYCYRCCGIFQGREKEGAPMICKIEQIKTEKSSRKLKYKIEISEGIDNLFMIILAMRLGLLKFNEKRRRLQNKDMNEMNDMYSMNEIDEMDDLI